MINGLAPFCWTRSLLLGSLPFAGLRRFLEGGNESEQGRPLLAAGNKILPANLPEKGPSHFIGNTQDLGGRRGGGVSLLTMCSRAGASLRQEAGGYEQPGAAVAEAAPVRPQDAGC